MIRTKGEAGTGDVVEAVRHVRSVQGQIKRLVALDEDEVYVFAKEVSRGTRAEGHHKGQRGGRGGRIGSWVSAAYRGRECMAVWSMVVTVEIEGGEGTEEGGGGGLAWDPRMWALP